MTLPAFADTGALAARLPGGIRDVDEPRAQAALDLASTLIRVEGHLDWITDDELDFTKGNAVVSEALKRDILQGVCLAAALRNFENPESFDQETGASSPTNVYLTRTEKRAVHEAAGFSGSFSIDTAAAITDSHAEVCALRFGADYCSCGADLTLGFPIYELP